MSDKVLIKEIDILDKEFWSVDATLNICIGKFHDYMGMAIDYSIDEKINITIEDYIEGIFNKLP